MLKLINLKAGFKNIPVQLTFFFLQACKPAHGRINLIYTYKSNELGSIIFFKSYLISTSCLCPFLHRLPLLHPHQFHLCSITPVYLQSSLVFPGTHILHPSQVPHGSFQMPCVLFLLNFLLILFWISPAHVSNALCCHFPP